MTWFISFQLFQWALRVIMTAIILRRRLPPSTTLAWLLMVLFLPEIGTFMYLLIGKQRLGRKRVRLHQQVIAQLRTSARLSFLAPHITQPRLDPALNPMIRQAEQVGGLPIVGGNHVELMPDTQGVIGSLIADMDKADRHVHLLYYIIQHDETGHRVADAALRTARRGVKVRIIADAVASRRFLGRSGRAGELRQAGVEVVAALPVAPLRRGLARLDIRNHRKLAVIDGHIAYAGSQNIVNADYGHRRAGMWHDLTGRFTGPIVWQMQQVFLEDWFFETHEMPEDEHLFPDISPTGDTIAQTVPTGPSDPSETFRRVLLSAINASQRKVILTTPYLILDEASQLALMMAAQRGVETSIVIPKISDHRIVTAAGRACYIDLLEAGVKIFRFKPGLLHAKTFTVDDAFGMLGSSNMDLRSFDINFELSILLYGPAITSQLRYAQNTCIERSDQIDLDEWRKRPILTQYMDSAAAVFSPLL